MTGWTVADIPDQSGRIALVTGATGGLGLETALALARAGAHVVLAGRNAAKGNAALGAIAKSVPHASVEFEVLDLASLASIHAFATAFRSAHQGLDLLVNNAGVMAIPRRQETEDGFERQFGTNYLGHFALTGLLMPALKRGRSSRVVNLASLAHRRGRIDFADPQGRRYAPWKAYSQSKLAMLMFGTEFQRRSAALGWGIVGISAHPGLALTDIFTSGPALGGRIGLRERLGLAIVPWVGQSAAQGALPILFAATALNIQPGGYYGPSGFYEMKGDPKPAFTTAAALDVNAAAKLWELSVHLTKVDPART